MIAVATDARGTRVELDADHTVTLGELMLLVVLRQMRQLGRHPRTFVRIDRRNIRSLALCKRVGLNEEQADPHDPKLVQRWGELPS